MGAKDQTLVPKLIASPKNGMIDPYPLKNNFSSSKTKKKI